MTAVVTGIAAVVAAGLAGGPPPEAAAAGKAKAAPRTVTITRFLGERRLPHMMKFQGTTVGGLSGIDRDPRTGTWYFVSDDRWRYDPARYYTGRLDIDPATGAFTGVRLSGVTTLRRPDGTPYPGYGKPESADPETIRYDPRTRRVLWGSEGDRPDASAPTIPVSDMSIRWAGRDGAYRGALPIPGGLRLTDTDKGPRRNLGFEALTFPPHGIAAMVEGPRYEDGEPPTVRHGGPARLTLWDRAGRVRAQYAYPVDPAPAAPVPASGYSDGGVSEILAVDDHRYLALERFWAEGVGYNVKLYEFDVRGATNVLARDSLSAGGPYRAARKRLVADLGSVSRPTQNLESLSWGPRLRGGQCSLVVGSDDNFDAQEVTQFLAFSVKGC
ncbi:esterase-like activity of phytase family protein [Actinomadura xylanilytica]|uniref:esterase-like activity of phytase family protein n=1 Tax=Actinomadura xylanilytica TaxID=887459 RepID=UPI00255A9281|nr:esterase-like activity of phytase family protein [Actinomadura xylanilytica]MDL4776604.1 esterase-like activity of phytase family protein [Actinomadura xylanilytica]